MWEKWPLWLPELRTRNPRFLNFIDVCGLNCGGWGPYKRFSRTIATPSYTLCINIRGMPFFGKGKTHSKKNKRRYTRNLCERVRLCKTREKITTSLLRHTPRSIRRVLLSASPATPRRGIRGLISNFQSPFLLGCII